MKVISLFDYSCIFLQPWLEAGYECYAIDIQHKNENINNLFKVKENLLNKFEHNFNKKDIAFISAFPPCDHTAVSGARHFKKKGLRKLAEALKMFSTAVEFCEWSDAPYFIENPISTISTYYRKPNYIFDPYEYGGYLPEDDEHPEYSDFIVPRDAYPKRTCLWTGNGFKIPAKKPVRCGLDYSKQYRKLGGKSLKTKNIRSATPRGFAKAVFLANRK